MIPFWAFPVNIAALIAGAFVMQFMVQGAWGIIPAHLAELSPDAIRGFLPGFGYQCGVLLASSIGLLQAVFARKMTYSVAMAATAAIVRTFGTTPVRTSSTERRRASSRCTLPRNPSASSPTLFVTARIATESFSIPSAAPARP